MSKHPVSGSFQPHGFPGLIGLLSVPLISSCGIFAEHVTPENPAMPVSHESATSTSATLAYAQDVANGRSNEKIGDAYWVYAALAADVYATRGVSETMSLLPQTWDGIVDPTSKTRLETRKEQIAAEDKENEKSENSTLTQYKKLSKPLQPSDTDPLNIAKICRLDGSIETQPRTVQMRCAALVDEEYRAYLENIIFKDGRPRSTWKPNDIDGAINWQEAHAGGTRNAIGGTSDETKDARAARIKSYLQRVDQQEKALNSRYGIAKNIDDCSVSKENNQPFIPIPKIREMGWRKIKAIDKYEHTAPWKLFVPELAIDVWEKRRDDRWADDGHGNKQAIEAYEYALVYRGTAGWGGWASNLQVVSIFTPLVWDQYRQSVEATRKIVRQIYFTRATLDEGKPRKPEILITAVGHSLGAGLAEYAYYRIPYITKVVGFNPTPVDGAHSLLGVEERQAVVDSKQGNPEPDKSIWPDNPLQDSSIFLLTEKGDILGKISPCSSGKLWGSEGGPSVTCEKVDLSRGSAFRQHDMRQLACKLAFLHFKNQGRSTTLAAESREN